MPPDDASTPVSRDGLRAELAEMELRLRMWFGNRIDLIDQRIMVIETAEFSEAQKRAIRSLCSDEMTGRESKGWTARQRWMNVSLACIALCSFALSAYLATHGGSG